MRQERSGYDHSINQDDCPHSWCHEKWHGLAITRRMREMRSKWHSSVHYYEDERRVSDDVVAELDAYRYDEDDSEVICPGSSFVGEFTPPEPRSRGDLGDGYPSASEMINAAVQLYGDLFTASTGIPALPDWCGDPVDGRGWTFSDVDTLRRSVQQLRAINSWPNPFLPGERPQSNEIEFYGGPRHRETLTVDDVARLDVIRIVPPVAFTVADFDPSNLIVNMPTPIEYRRTGWNAETRRWVYSTESDWRPQCGYCRRQPVRDLDDKYCQDCVRDLIVAESHREGVRYAQQHGIQRPVVATHESHIRGMDLEMFRIHVIDWPDDQTHRLLRQRALLAGHPLESFYANPDSTEQAA
ncbi:hypothetical protein [Nocardia sp. NPDC049707]|uniref:hypothetical protein n=1 Tax=Nocardia sp. NPDC049707 TaxID=3154735 RepID=UPI00342E67EB